jgi:hypothetical protein
MSRPNYSDKGGDGRPSTKCQATVAPPNPRCPHSLPSPPFGRCGASVLQSQGKYDKAESLVRRALEGRKKVLGPKHPDTLVSVSNLVSLLQDQGKYHEAGSLISLSARRAATEFSDEPITVSNKSPTTSHIPRPITCCMTVCTVELSRLA